MENSLEPRYLTPEDLKFCYGKRVVIDTETDGLFWYRNKIVGVGIYCPDADIWGYINCPTERHRDAIYEEIQQIPAGTTVIMHNAKFDLHMLHADHRKLGWKLIDTTVLVHLYDSRERKSMASVEAKFFGSTSKRSYSAVIDRRIKNKIWLWPEEIRMKYCCNDCVVTWQFAEYFCPKIVEMGLWALFLKDMEYLGVIKDLENHGVLLNTEYIDNSEIVLRKAMDAMIQYLMDSTGQEFNWRSPKQLSQAIYENMGISKPVNPFLSADGIDHSRYAGRNYNASCTSAFLLMEKAHHPLGELIMSMREIDKFLKNYLKSWKELKDDQNQLHANYNITGTRTGRLSSSKPNLQNVPSDIRGRIYSGVYSGDLNNTVRKDEFNLRKAIIARPGKVFVSVDYKQMEMRMFGIESADPFMLDTLKAGKDVHAEIAQKVWGIRDEVHREWSKMISFGLIYGMTTGSLRFKLNMTHEEAVNVTNQYWAEFPRIQPWIEEIIQQCRDYGYIEYWSGRRWREDNAMDFYKGANAKIQGGCADLLSIASIRVDKWLNTQGSDHFLIHTVHDELISEVPKESAQKTAEEVGRLMQVEDIFGISFVTDAKIGEDYGSLTKLAQKNEPHSLIPEKVSDSLSYLLPDEEEEYELEEQ